MARFHQRNLRAHTARLQSRLHKQSFAKTPFINDERELPRRLVRRRAWPVLRGYTAASSPVIRSVASKRRLAVINCGIRDRASVCVWHVYGFIISNYLCDIIVIE